MMLSGLERGAHSFGATRSGSPGRTGRYIKQYRRRDVCGIFVPAHQDYFEKFFVLFIKHVSCEFEAYLGSILVFASCVIHLILRIQWRSQNWHTMCRNICGSVVRLSFNLSFLLG